MATSFDRDQLLDAFDQIGRAAVAAGTKLQIAVYGGSALMLASNFRFATEDVDIAEITKPWPEWLANVVARIASEKGWSEDWLNDSVQFHLSPLADQSVDHLEYGTFPRDASQPGLSVSVPSAEYLLALKLKSIRVLDPKKGDAERRDIVNLMKVAGITRIDEAIAILGRYFPASAQSSEKQRFLLKNMDVEGSVDAPRYNR